MNLEKAIITLSLKTDNLFISAFEEKLCFGKLRGKEYPMKQSFTIPFYKLYLWYLSFIKIIGAITSERITTAQKDLIEAFDADTNYYWEVLESKKVCFGIEFNSNISLKTVFDLTEFNNFVFTIKTLSFHTLNLQPFQHDLFINASKLPLEDILNFKDLDFCLQFIQKHFSKAPLSKQCQVECQILLQYYREQIVLQNKLETFFNPHLDHSDQVISLILDST